MILLVSEQVHRNDKYYWKYQGNGEHINNWRYFRSKATSFFFLPFSKSCKMGTILVFQNTSSTSISVFFSCKSAFEPATEKQNKRKSREKGVTTRTLPMRVRYPSLKLMNSGITLHFVPPTQLILMRITRLLIKSN